MPFYNGTRTCKKLSLFNFPAVTTTTAATTTTIGQSQQCQQFEVIGVSSETSGVYELSEIRSDRKPENLVWKKPKEDRYIFKSRVMRQFGYPFIKTFFDIFCFLP